MSSTSTVTGTRPKGAVDKYFQISERGSSIGQEIRGGLVTFFAMSYIIVLNPLILGAIPSAQGTFIGGDAAGPNLQAVAVGTSLAAGVMTIAMGFFANFSLFYKTIKRSHLLLKK
jgi:AGZA family xanthine/uracil permease-like MFS transporter